MNELRSIKTYSDLSTLSLNDQTKFRLNEINKIKDYFEFEIKEREALIKKMSKYTAALDYADKILIVLSATSGGISIISFTNVIRNLAGVISASLALVFSLTTRIMKKLLKETRKEKKKHSKIVMLAKSKLNSIETLMPQALIDLETSYEEFKRIKKISVKMHKLIKKMFSCLYCKVVVITVEKYANTGVHTITVESKKLFCVKMIDVQKGLGLKNIRIWFETKNPTEEQKKKYIRTESEITKNLQMVLNISMLVVIPWKKIIKNCREVKKCNDGINRMKKEEQRENFRYLFWFKEHDTKTTLETTLESLRDTFEGENI